jgi:hypothetical protein
MRTRTLTAVFLLIILIIICPNRLDAQSATSGLVITKLNIKPTLENMGFETKDLGNNIYEIVTNQGTVVPMTVSLSTDESRIWLTSFFGDKDLAGYTADKLVKLLQSNWATGVSFFALDGNKLKMTRPVENRNVTPVLLRKEIESQARSVNNTQSLWSNK